MSNWRVSAFNAGKRLTYIKDVEALQNTSWTKTHDVQDFQRRCGVTIDVRITRRRDVGDHVITSVPAPHVTLGFAKRTRLGLAANSAMTEAFSPPQESFHVGRDGTSNFPLAHPCAERSSKEREDL